MFQQYSTYLLKDLPKYLTRKVNGKSLIVIRASLSSIFIVRRFLMNKEKCLPKANLMNTVLKLRSTDHDKHTFYCFVNRIKGHPACRADYFRRPYYFVHLCNGKIILPHLCSPAYNLYGDKLEIKITQSLIWKQFAASMLNWIICRQK